MELGTFSYPTQRIRRSYARARAREKEIRASSLGSGQQQKAVLCSWRGSQSQRAAQTDAVHALILPKSRSLGRTLGFHGAMGRVAAAAWDEGRVPDENSSIAPGSNDKEKKLTRRPSHLRVMDLDQTFSGDSGQLENMPCYVRLSSELIILPIQKTPEITTRCFALLGKVYNAGKLLERIIADRLEAFTEGPAGLADSQFGFRKGRSTIDAIQTSGCPPLREATGAHSYARKAASIHRRACLRAICGFRSISHEAVHVLAGTPPLVLFVEERSRLYEHCREDARRDATSEERAKTLEKCQTQWFSATKGRWTYRLILSIAVWIERRHGEVKYHLTQILSGYGCFRSYLYRTKHCQHCHLAVEDVEHVIFHCPRFTAEREEPYRPANGPLEPKTLRYIIND
ncbi:unnamed protein product [Trichogramma brassicae]|uniref:Reverse transcriptase domain-containing protein n=1 Tax=Trichogramma brassicae TaxID=86971 RepID=A0A6H5IJ33_9HYME|nr:unnamed protein product [Trichogramma brassicae]